MNGLRVLIVTGIWPPDVGGPASLLATRRDAEALASTLTALGSDRELAARLRDGAAATEPVTAQATAIELALERAAADE